MKNLLNGLTKCIKTYIINDGTTGGTCNAVQYGKKLNKEIIRINPQDFYEKG